MRSLVTFGWPALILPIFVMGLVAIATPRLLARFLPEGVPYLIVIWGLSVAICLLASSLVFIGLYGLQDRELLGVIFDEAARGAWFFLRLGGSSALFWLPILVLSLNSLPKRWKEIVW